MQPADLLVQVSRGCIERTLAAVAPQRCHLSAGSLVLWGCLTCMGVEPVPATPREYGGLLGTLALQGCKEPARAGTR